MVSTIVHQLKGFLLAEQVRLVLIHIMPLMQRQYHEQARAEVGSLVQRPDDDTTQALKPLEDKIDDAFAAVCRAVEDVMSVSAINVIGTRKHDEVIARQVVIFCMCEELHRVDRMTYKELAACFDGRIHHATIIYARRKVLDLISCDPIVHRQVKAIGERLAVVGFCRVLETVVNARILNRNI